jgi:putative endonuclease
MTMREREGLIARISQLRRRAAATDSSARHPTVDPPEDRVDALEARLAHLERLVEGLQDSVHRESERHSKLIAELQAQTQPGPMGAALAEDARSRGL